MTYNTLDVIEAKRALSEHAAEIVRTGGPHQQSLAKDIRTLVLAHSEAIEQINILEQQQKISGDNTSELLDRLEAATRAAKDADAKLAALAPLGIASTTGATLADLKGTVQSGSKPT